TAVLSPNRNDGMRYSGEPQPIQEDARCDSQACTLGRDGIVRCTEIATGTTRVVAEVGTTVPAHLSERDGHCFASGTNGVFDLRAPSAPLFVQHLASRTALSGDGRFLVSGDFAGELIVYDLERREVIAKRASAHDGRVTAVRWSHGRWITAGLDG